MANWKSPSYPFHLSGNNVVNWPAIVEQHGPYVWRTAFRLLSDREDASDCYQETFLKAVEYSNQHEIKNWPGLLKRIATSRALDRLRRRYRKRTESLGNGETALARDPAPDEPLQQQEWLARFRQLLAELPERQAEVFWLSEVETLEHKEIAEQFGATPKEVAMWLHRAKQKLRRLLVERGIAGEVQR